MLLIYATTITKYRDSSAAVGLFSDGRSVSTWARVQVLFTDVWRVLRGSPVTVAAPKTSNYREYLTSGESLGVRVPSCVTVDLHAQSVRITFRLWCRCFAAVWRSPEHGAAWKRSDRWAACH